MDVVQFQGGMNAKHLAGTSGMASTSLDALSRKLEDTHGEIARVRGEVVESLRSFYATSSAISPEEAMKIASKWASSGQLPTDSQNEQSSAAASDLQDKIRHLNGTLLETLDRLQLGDGEELAPQAKLVTSFAQREQVAEQIRQSTAVIALTEKLTQVDGLLGGMDSSIDQHRFVAAAEGIAGVEKLLLEILDTAEGKGDSISIVRLVRLQLASKKTRLLGQLTQFFASAVLWQDGALKVSSNHLAASGDDSTMLSPENLRQEFWRACEVLDVLTPKLKELAKAISQHLMKPLLQSPHGAMEFEHDASGSTATLVTQQPKSSESTGGVEVQEKCTSVTNALLFVHSEVFVGNSELMHRLGDFMWKIPGNLEAQLMNLLQHKIPQDATLLDTYRDALVTAIHDLENKLVAAGFSACSNSQLRDFVTQLTQLHSKKRRQGILSRARDLMHQDYHHSVKMPTPTSNASSDDTDSGCFQLPGCYVTVCAHDVVELAHKTLLEGCTTGAASAHLLFQTSRDLLFLFRAVVPTLYEREIASNAETCMLFHNDCMYIAHHMLTIGHLYKHRLPAPLNRTATMSDMVPAFRDAGERALTAFIMRQADELLADMTTLPPLGAVNSEVGMTRVEEFLKEALFKLNELSAVWREGLSPPIYTKSVAQVLQPFAKSFVDGVLAESKISESARAHLHLLLPQFFECEALFDSQVQAEKCVPSLGRLARLATMLTDSLTTIQDRFEAGDLSVFSSEELEALVKALFRDSGEKSAFLQALAST